MDFDEYLPMFLAEAGEHLQTLNLAVVRVEERPDDTETINEIFRIAHTFKGMSATMGFAQLARLTHTMEDVFELLRQRRSGLSREAVDVLLECLDTLQEAIERIEATGHEELEPDALIEKLDGLVYRRNERPQVSTDVTKALEVVKQALEADTRVLHVRVRLSPDSAMPGVRAYMVYAALAEHGDILVAVPGEAELESFTDNELQIWLVTEQDEPALEAAASGVPDVAGVTLAQLSRPDELEKAKPAMVERRTRPEGERPGALEPVKSGPRAPAMVRVDAERLDSLMHLMGEVVVHRTRVESVAARVPEPELGQAVSDLVRSSQALQAMVMQVRMVPVQAVLLRFPRLVRDLSVKLGKQVELDLVGKETELDRSVVDSIGDPLVHLVRNALDHGFEPPAEREAAGKNPTGRLEIAARHAGGRVVVEVRDDGRGIDPAKVAAVAVKRGLMSEDEAASIDMARAIELLFAPGFSTAERTTDVSGRGVGMDAVRNAVRELGGEVVMTSEQGRGTLAQIRLPLTLAIVSALLVEIGGHPFALPLDRVESTLRVGSDVLATVAGRPVLNLREGVLPFCDATALGGEAGAERFAVVVRTDERRIALGVERLLGQTELVTRALPAAFGNRAAVSGAAVLPDGGIALIIDCDALESGPASPSAAALAA